MRLDVTQSRKARARPQSHDLAGDRRAFAQRPNGAEFEAVPASAQDFEPLTIGRDAVDECHVL